MFRLSKPFKVFHGRIESILQPIETREANRNAAMKAARILAHPRTPVQTRNSLETAVCDLANATDVQVYHPALVERALTVMFESMKKRNPKVTITPNRRESDSELIKVLDQLEG